MSNDHSEQGHVGELVEHRDSGDHELRQELDIRNDVLDIAAERMLADAKGEALVLVPHRILALQEVADWANRRHAESMAASAKQGMDGLRELVKASVYVECAAHCLKLILGEKP